MEILYISMALLVIIVFFLFGMVYADMNTSNRNKETAFVLGLISFLLIGIVIGTSI